MKKWFVLALFVPLLAFGQGRLSAFLVNVETNHLSTVVMGTNSLYRAGLDSRYQFSVQHFAEALDLWAGGVAGSIAAVANSVVALGETVTSNAAVANANSLVLSNDFTYLQHYLMGGDGTHRGVPYTFASNITWDGSTYDSPGLPNQNSFWTAALVPAIRTNATFQAKNAEIANWNKFLTEYLLRAVIDAAEIELPAVPTNWPTEMSTNGFPWQFVDQTAFTVPIPGFGTFSYPTNFSLQSGLRVDLTATSNRVDDAEEQLASLQFDRLDFLEWGWTGVDTLTTRTNIYTAEADYLVSAATNSALGYRAASGPLGFGYDAGMLRGVRVLAPGRYTIRVNLDVADLAPVASGGDPDLEGSFFYELRAYNKNGDATGWWRPMGVLHPPSAGWVPATLAGGAPNAYQRSVGLVDSFLVSTVSASGITYPVSEVDFIEYRIMARFFPSGDPGAVPAVHQVRTISFALQRTATQQ